jgi:hypothetical protein
MLLWTILLCSLSANLVTSQLGPLDITAEYDPGTALKFLRDGPDEVYLVHGLLMAGQTMRCPGCCGGCTGPAAFASAPLLVSPLIYFALSYPPPPTPCTRLCCVRLHTVSRTLSVSDAVILRTETISHRCRSIGGSYCQIADGKGDPRDPLNSQFAFEA